MPRLRSIYCKAALIKYLNHSIGSVALLFLLGAGCSRQEPITSTAVLVPATVTSVPSPTMLNASATPALTPISSATVMSTEIELQIPYKATSVWNTPIGPSPEYDAHSVDMVDTLARTNEGRIITAGPDFNYPVYFADGETPRYDIPCLMNKCTIASSDQEIIRTEIVKNVPIPLDAQPGDDSDGRMIIVDTVSHTEYDLSKAQRTAAGWTAGTVSIYNILWDGTPVGHSSRGSGIPAYAGLLRPWEIRQGRIQHALAFGYAETARRKCVFPASKTDGESKLPFAIPEGARLQLDPSLTNADFDDMGLDPTGKIIARALQEYGMILVDTSGSLKIYVEDLINNPYASEDWTDADLNLTKDSIYDIPYTSFRVLELPPGYWDSSDKKVRHGKCLTFPGSLN